jgi:Zn-dependent protease
MPSRGTYTLFRIRGIPIGVDWSWFFVLFLIIWLLSGSYRDVLIDSQDSTEPYVFAVISAFLFFGSILLHELGHAMEARRHGIGTTHITLWMFGGIAGLERDSRTAGEEFKVAAAGPAVTAALAIVCLGLGYLSQGSAFTDALAYERGADVSPWATIVAFLAYMNVIILAFNLIPAYPLDGGRIARAIAWRWTGDRERATTIAARLGQGFAMLFIAIGVLLVFQGDFVGGVWLGVIGWMLGQSARATVVRNELNRRIGDVSVADVMDADPVAIADDASVATALDEYFLRYQWPWFPVVDPARHFVGLLKRGTADGVPEISRADCSVAELLDPTRSESQRVRDDEPLEALLGNAELRRLGALAAIDADGRLSGVITLEQVGRALRDAVEGRGGGRGSAEGDPGGDPPL